MKIIFLVYGSNIGMTKSICDASKWVCYENCCNVTLTLERKEKLFIEEYCTKRFIISTEKMKWRNIKIKMIGRSKS